MDSLARRIDDMVGLLVRLHMVKGKADASFVDGTCQGVERGCAVLFPSSLGNQTEIPLGNIAALTQLSREFEAEGPENSP